MLAEICRQDSTCRYATDFTLPRAGGSKARYDPSGRVMAAYCAIQSEDPPRKLARARFRPSRAREGEVAPRQAYSVNSRSGQRSIGKKRSVDT